MARVLEVKGIVQGVGFRPFVFNLANQCRLKGRVANTSGGLSIHVEGIREGLEAFCSQLAEKGPPLARITEISVRSESLKGYSSFKIVASQRRALKTALIPPDVSVCEDCLRELFDPNDRRYGYPLINCTNCGPRYTIIADLPYDRPHTVMRAFTMCDTCRDEYNDPANRRFHAQPNACFDCGPQATLLDGAGNRVPCGDPLDEAASLLKQGHILAVKGLGGFHIAADAANRNAVTRLRQKKHREEKPLAVMSYDPVSVRQYAHVGPEEKILLTSHCRPIVILRKKKINPLSEGISPQNGTVGVMLPYTPIHYLLLKHDFIALIMTSGNLKEEPIIVDNAEALSRLAQVADYFLMHDRDIYLRCDDSIVRETAGATRFLRRARGYVPAPILLKKKHPQVLACGAELKNTVCLIRDDQAFVSQHIGDLTNLETFTSFEQTINHLKRVLDVNPEIIAHDLHPDYISTRYAQENGAQQRIQVQHHHAHILSCMAENRIEGPAIGLSFDGTGFGADGHVWGGEIMIAEPLRYTRIGHLSNAPMPGGSSAIKEPWRMAVSYLYATFGNEFWNLDLPWFEDVGEKRIKIIIEMIKKNINTPATSSMGRFFDGIAGIIGLGNRATYEGQAAITLENLMGDNNVGEIYDYEWTSGDMHRMVFQPIITGVLKDIKKGVDASIISGRFHLTLIRMISGLCEVIRREWDLNRIVLSGGVFQNAFLLTGLTRALEEKNFEIFCHRLVPTNDGGISLGQAVIAASMANG